MVEWFKKSDLCIKFLENYPYELLSEIIPNVFEIGILTLKNSFNKFYFKWEEIRDILYDLRKNNYYDNLNFKSMRKIIDFKDFFENEEYNEEKERLIFSGKKIFPKTQKIYPDWWWNQNNQNPYKNNYSKKYKSQQFIPYNKKFNETEYQKENKIRNYSHHKKNMKIKKLTKEDFYNYNKGSSNKGNNYDQRNNVYLSDSNQNNLNKNPKNLSDNSNQVNKKKINYKISYDKDLKVEKIEKKGEMNNQYSYYKGNIDKNLPENNI